MLGGTSLLGGRGNLVATAIAALFLAQLDQFVLALGVTLRDPHARPGAALAVGVALYTIDWGGLARRLAGASPGTARAHLPGQVVFRSGRESPTTKGRTRR